LARVRDEFARSATLAMDAGFDGVELHAANGYLLEQFLHPLSNQRTDRYGGSVTNRARFVLDVTRAVAEVIGADRTGIRLSPWGVLGDMPHYEEIDETYEYLAAELQQLGVVYVHLVSNGSSAGLALPALTVEAIRGRFRRTLIINGGLHSLDAIDESLDTGHADLVAVGRPFVANPDFVERLSAGVPLAALEPATLFAPGPRGFADGYTDYPRATPPRTLAAA
jgi:N-ethylmaleimide reductase